ncbi:TolC family protein [Anatilimnocola floriformis]|uniref:TolC family protein n=1 Tax=Anatilimnocola floriformis TaxID=2948575 RepID=UPI0020C41FFF|nr:TolC family protein [Anatilimnocola floriformis]
MSFWVGLCLGVTSLGCRGMLAESKQSAQADAPPEVTAPPELPAPRETPRPKENSKAPEVLAQPKGTATPSRTARERFDALLPLIDTPENALPAGPLPLQQIQQSVIQQFPLVLAAIQEAQVIAGKQQAAQGAFDVKLVAESLNMPQGYYENYRHLVKAEQPTLAGGSVYGQYRIGRGYFQPWYGERATNEGGEFKLGFATPLLRGRAIDERRAEIFRTDLQAGAVDPIIRQQQLESLLVASYVYWSWVAAGRMYVTTESLLDVAQQRNRGLARQEELGNLPRTEVQQNERLIATRQAKLIEANRKLQGAAVKLSLFLRDAAGDPIVPTVKQLPIDFPTMVDPRELPLEDAITAALDRRPELQLLQIDRQLVDVDLQLSQNELLPNLTAVMEASKDVGYPASSKGDKTPFELEAGLLFDVPVQRNKAHGKIQAARGKLNQLTQKQQFTVNKVVAEVQDAQVGRVAAFERVGRARRGAALAKELVLAEYRSFELGNSDLLRIAIQEAAELDAQILEIEALQDYFQAEAQYNAAIGLLPF